MPKHEPEVVRAREMRGELRIYKAVTMTDEEFDRRLRKAGVGDALPRTHQDLVRELAKWLSNSRSRDMI